MVTIRTIGYGGKKPEDFFSELESMEPDLVVDVRENPYRAYLGVYTKPSLEKRLGGRYTWVGELGNRSRELPPTLVDEEAGLRRLRGARRGPPRAGAPVRREGRGALPQELRQTEASGTR